MFLPGNKFIVSGTEPAWGDGSTIVLEVDNKGRAFALNSVDCIVSAIG